ncbi:hypothetical protein ACFJGV_10880 [Cnuibacter sp. UC19_7]|uniref:hypothetical protein n=1 Tax=Cnuibacter sp. UC19_7 TaxID=3350166 RepID=UPI003671122B
MFGVVAPLPAWAGESDISSEVVDDVVNSVVYIAHGEVFDADYNAIGSIDEVAEALNSDGSAVAVKAAEHLTEESAPIFAAEQASRDANGITAPEQSSSQAAAAVEAPGCSGYNTNFILREYPTVAWPAVGAPKASSPLRCGNSGAVSAFGWRHVWSDGHKADYQSLVAATHGPIDDSNMKSFLQEFIFPQTLGWPLNVVDRPDSNSWRYSTTIEIYDNTTETHRTFIAYVAVGKTTQNIVTSWPSTSVE